MEDDTSATEVASVTSVHSGSKKRKITYRNEFDLQSPVTTPYIDEVFNNLKVFCSSLVTNNNQGIETTNFHKMISSVSKATNLAAIISACSLLEIVISENATMLGIKCKSCYSAYETGGFFKFGNADPVQSIGKSNQPILSSKFKGLRCIIRNHLMSANHGKNARRTSQRATDSIATMSYVEEKVDEIKLFLKQLFPSAPEQIVGGERKPQSLISKSTSISDILVASAHLKLQLHSVPTENVCEFNTLACVPCRNLILIKNPDSKSKLGLFKYDSIIGSNFGGHKNNQQLQPLKFRQLKDKVSNHLNSKVHCNAVGIAYIPTQKEIELNEKNKKTGMILGKLAYKAIVRYQSKISFEEEVTFLSDIGVNVGDINHSVDYVDKLFPQLHFVLKEQTMTVLHNPVATYLQSSPFVVFADKITPYGTTLQIIGIIVFKDGKNTPITLDVLPVKHKIQNGSALAQDIVDTLYQFYTPESAKKLYVGCSFDGQYIALKVPQEILRLLGFPINADTPLEQLNQELFHSYSWDPAHLLELACGDVKKSKLHEWVEKTEQTIVTINRGNTYGKPYLRLLEEARQMDVVLMRPGSFSETRFSSYKHRVLNRFLNNYPVLYKTHAEDQDSDLNLINNCEFVLRLSGLVDIFEIIGNISGKIQSSELLPWECDTIIEDGMVTLEDMTKSIFSLPVVTDSNWKKFGEAIQEITDFSSFKGKPILIQKTAFYVTRSHSIIIERDNSFQAVIRRVMTEIKFYVKSLADSLRTRYSKNHTQKTCVVARDSFSRTAILERDSDEIPHSFVEYCEMAKKWGFLEAQVSQDTLNNQYNSFCGKVKQVYNQRLQEFGLLVPESLQYWEIMTMDEERENIALVLNLLLTSMVRNKSECIAESIGSMMKVHLEKRCNLSDKNLGMEIFLHFNGPRANRECNGLVRKANRKLFGKDGMHFHRVSKPSELKFWEDGSKVITKIHSHNGRIIVPDTDI